MKVKVKINPKFDYLKEAFYGSEHAACFDLFAATEEEIMIWNGKMVAVPTGLHMEIPVGYFGDMRPRSGLAFKHQVVVVNAPGTIDADFRGEIHIGLLNLGHSLFVVKPGMRIAQMMIRKYEKVDFEIAEQISNTQRGINGYGSTGGI